MNPTISAEELEATGVETPAIACVTSDIRQRITNRVADHVNAGLHWRLPFSAHSCVQTLRLVAPSLLEGGRYASSLLTPDLLSSMPSPWDLLLTTPAGTSAGWRRIAISARTVRLMVACEQFAQVEPLAAACRAAGTTAEILIRIDVGPRRFGVRPGLDLDDLARGIVRLEGVRLAGLMADRGAAVFGVANLSPAAMCGLLETGRRIIDRYAVPDPVVSVAHRNQVESTPGEVGLATEARTPLDLPIMVIATVVSRPTRDVAVLNVGQASVGDCPILTTPPGATVDRVANDVTILILEGDALRLAVGDPVFLSPSERCPPRSLHGREMDLLMYDSGSWQAVPH